MVVKHSTWDAQLDRQGRLTASERRELAHLEDRIDRAAVLDLVETHLPFAGRRLFSACTRAAAERVSHVGRARRGRARSRTAPGDNTPADAVRSSKRVDKETPCVRW